MPISFTAAERKSITRRQIRIDLENSGFQKSEDFFAIQQASLLEVDAGNTKFYNTYSAMVDGYESEVRQMNGTIPDVYSPSDLIAAAQTPSIPPFFPVSPTPYVNNIPLIQDGSNTNNKVKGFFHPTGTDVLSEQTIFTNPAAYSGLTEMNTFLNSGITGVSNASTTTTQSIPGGTITGQVVTVTSPLNFTVGDLTYIASGASSGIYKITATVPLTSITIDSVLPSVAGLPSGANIYNTAAGFSAGDRQTLVTSPFQEILTNITGAINTLVTTWNSKLNTELSALSTNGDDRLTQAAQIVTATANINATKVILNAWLALSDTGVSGKYTASSMLPIMNETTARQAVVTSRIVQITTALGGSSAAALSQSGATYTSTDLTNPYYKRYKWLNFRINRASGSLRRYYSAIQSQGAVQALKADNVAIQAEYNGYFLTKPIIFNDGSNIIHVKDVIGYGPGDTITIVSETQPEITRTIIQLMGTTQIKLSAIVPTTYKLEDVARLFKTL